jgi:hypothetical protein
MLGNFCTIKSKYISIILYELLTAKKEQLFKPFKYNIYILFCVEIAVISHLA